MIEPALALVEFSSIAAGILAADAMVKRAPIDTIKTGTVQPGKYLVLIGGMVADVEESVAAGREVGASAVVDYLLLPQVHPRRQRLQPAYTQRMLVSRGPWCAWSRCA